jgi:ribulose-phosphate 3-epimerase
MADAGVNQYTFHVEATDDVPDVCRKVKEAGMMVRTAPRVFTHIPERVT